MGASQLVSAKTGTETATQTWRIGTSAPGDNKQVFYEPPAAPADTIGLSERRMRSRTRRRLWGIIVISAAVLIGALSYIAVVHQSQDSHQAFVRAAFEHLLARHPDTSETSFWVSKMARGADPMHVATDLVNSTEYRDDVIKSYYETYLAHPAEQAAFSFWGAQLSAGASDQTVQEGILGSVEFYSDAGHTPSGFIGTLYEKLLARAPTTAEVASAEKQLSSGASHTTVATSVIDSKEYRVDFVDSYYHYLIGSRPDEAEVNHWLFVLASGASDQSVTAGIVGSSQFYSLNS